MEWSVAESGDGRLEAFRAIFGRGVIGNDQLGAVDPPDLEFRRGEYHAKKQLFDRIGVCNQIVISRPNHSS
jgi:hypothetical protein